MKMSVYTPHPSNAGSIYGLDNAGTYHRLITNGGPTGPVRVLLLWYLHDVLLRRALYKRVS